MQVSLYTALALLVLTAIGFLIGRRRALAAARSGQDGARERLHSLPNYHGYYIALWTGAPALILIALYGVLGSSLTNMLALGELERASAPLRASYEQALTSDDRLIALALQTREAEGEIVTVRAALAAAREDSDRAGSEAFSGRLTEALRARNDATAEAAARRAELAAALVAGPQGQSADARALAGFEYFTLPAERRELFISDARAFAFGEGLPSRDTPQIRATAQLLPGYQNIFRFSIAALALAGAVLALTLTRGRIHARFRARNRVERVVSVALLICSIIAILTTIGIVGSLLFESGRFFASIDWRVHEFLFGTQWSPQIGIRADQIGQTGAFGAVPLFAGTALIMVIAMFVAVPVGLFAAIFLSEYAGPTTRAWAKPALEVLAGIPTVVYGFFALLTVGPFLRDFALFLGYEDAVTQSALAAGLVMGVMIIPFVSSLSDDVINAVPQSLRDGSYAMGATKSETVRLVVMPAALPGIVGAVLLAVSRAVGETMIVVMAAGQGANLTANPLESVTTITVQIVMLLTGDQEFDSPKTLSAFALGLVLFVMTLCLNVLALHVVRRYREKYD
ncbi:MAG: phosphate ABC transporter permease subunit PstC [Pseudomonadota bacterium]